MKKNITLITLLIISIFLLTLNLHTCNQNRKEVKQYENLIEALNDTISFNKKTNTYSQSVPVFDLDELIKSETYNHLDSLDKAYYKELKKLKKIIASSKANITVTDTVQSISYIKPDSTIQFTNPDTIAPLQYVAIIDLKGDSVSMDIEYEYNATIHTYYKRQRDNSIIVNYELSDPNMKVNKINSFIIPQQTKKTKIGQFFYKNKTPFIITGGVILFTGGLIGGYYISK